MGTGVPLIDVGAAVAPGVPLAGVPEGVALGVPLGVAVVLGVSVGPGVPDALGAAVVVAMVAVA